MIIIRNFSLSEELAGRKTLYHGTSKERANKIKEEGIKPNQKGWYNSPEDDYVSRGWDPEKFKGKIYLLKDKKSAKWYAKDRGGRDGEVLKVSIPYEEHRNMKRSANPEREYNGISHLHTKDEFSRAFLGKPYQEQDRKTKKRLKGAEKYANSETVIEGEIPTKYIKGSKDYEPVTAKEILKYQKARLTGNYKDYDNN